MLKHGATVSSGPPMLAHSYTTIWALPSFAAMMVVPSARLYRGRLRAIDGWYFRR